MKLKPVTVILVLLALALGGVVYLTQAQSPPPGKALEAGGQKIFAFEEKQVQSFTLKTQLRSLSFEKDREGHWQMKPELGRANDATVAYLLNLLATGRSDRVLRAPATGLKEFGLHQPLATIDVKLDNQQTHQLVLGEYDFNRSFIYAQADPPAVSSGELKVLLVSPDFENAVSRPPSDWKQSPKAD